MMPFLKNFNPTKMTTTKINSIDMRYEDLASGSGRKAKMMSKLRRDRRFRKDDRSSLLN